MILKTRKPIKKDVEGDFKTVKKFAWKPKWVENTLIWLESYESKQKYQWVHIEAGCGALQWVEYNSILMRYN